LHLNERRTLFVRRAKPKQGARADEEDVMRGFVTPMLGAIGAGMCLTAWTPTPPNPEIARSDVYAWRWTVDTILDAQRKAPEWDVTLPATGPNDSERRPWSFIDWRAGQDLAPSVSGGA
jgi:hypothetical protein